MRQCQISWLYCLISYIKMEPQCITFFFYVAPFIPCWVISIAFRIKRYGFCCHWLLWACGFSRNRHSLRLRLFITLDFIAVFSSCLGTSSAVLFRLRRQGQIWAASVRRPCSTASRWWLRGGEHLLSDWRFFPRIGRWCRISSSER